MIRRIAGLALVLCLASPGSVAARPAKAKAPATAVQAVGASGVVAADHEAASNVGVAVLKAGGDAVDAAVATALALGVVNPHSSGLGGGGFMVVWRAKERKAYALDFREVAPAALRRGTFTRPGVPKEASRWGGLAVGVPGELAGLEAAHTRWGKLHWAETVKPAIKLAQDGFAAGEALAGVMEHYGEELRLFPDVRRRFLRPDGEPVKAGDVVKRPRLAKTLDLLSDAGSKGFYQGPVAKAIVDAVRAAGGVMTLKDLAAYKVREREPLVRTYRGHQVVTMPPPSSGGVALLAVLGTLEARNGMPSVRESPERVHLLTEALKHAFADRARELGDPDYASVSGAALLDPSLLRGRAKALTADHTRPTKEYGRTAPNRESGTSHLSVIDAEGNAVALTTTINTGFGALVVAGATGILLNNEVDDFTTRPGEPNAFGLIQSKKNEIAPGKRPLSSMTPTIVLDGRGRPVAVAGASGGPRIITATLQAVLNVVDHHMDPAHAVSAPRIHHQWLPDELLIEEGAVTGGAAAMKAKGHTVKVGPLSYGAVQVAAVREDGRRVGASDPRKHGRAAAY